MRRWSLITIAVVGVALLGQAQIATLEATVSMQKVDGISTLMSFSMPIPSYERQQRTTIDLGGAWKKQRFAADHALTLRKRDAAGMTALLAEAAGRQSPWYVDTAWALKTIPGVENTMNVYEKPPETYQDGVWYRRTFNVDPGLSGTTARLSFLAVNYVADVWLNGVYLGWHEGGYTPFSFDVTSALRTDSANVLVVRVDNIPWNASQTNDPTNGQRIDIVPYYRSDWFNYTGIIHDVYLEFLNPVSIPRADAIPLDTAGTVQINTGVMNRSGGDATATLRMKVYEASMNAGNIQSIYASDLKGSEVSVGGSTEETLTIQQGSVRGWTTMISIPSPKLWTPKNPHLYVLEVVVEVGGSVRDTFCTQFGVRTARTNGARFELNGIPVFFPGLARHEDHPTYGRSVPKEVIYQDLLKVRSLNAAFLRTAHYPNHPYTYQIADRIGLAVLEEVPLFWFDSEDAWAYQETRRISYQMFREMVFRDLNRPSILLWSACNECAVVGGRRTYLQTLKADQIANYPDGRLLTQSAAADRPGPTDASQGDCDVAGWTMYFGIFHGGTYYAGTKQFLQDAHAAYPNKPILDTEFGYWSSENGSNLTKQNTVFVQTYLAFSEAGVRASTGEINPNGFLMGMTWWCAFDWYTSQLANGYQSMGVLHMNRQTTKQVTSTLQAYYQPYFDNLLLTSANDDPVEIPSKTELYQNYPNPFNPTTQFGMRIAEFGVVKVAIFDLLGREVAVLVNEEKAPGFYTVTWDATGLASGVYHCELNSGTSRDMKRVAFLK